MSKAKRNINPARNISISLPQRLIEDVEDEIQRTTITRSEWIKIAIQNRFNAPQSLEDRKMFHIILELIHRSTNTDREQFLLDELWLRMYPDIGGLPPESRNGIILPPASENTSSLEA
jgi:hypothetical protein